MNQIKRENLITLALESARRANNFADYEVIQEAMNQLSEAKDYSEELEAFEYLNVSLRYRKHLIEKKEIETFEQYRSEHKALDYDYFASLSFVKSAFIYKRDKSLLKVENEKGSVLTINRSAYGYQFHTPIKPNLKTGSSMQITGDQYSGISFIEAIALIENYVPSFPNFFTKDDITSVKLQTIEESISQWRDSWDKIK